MNALEDPSKLKLMIVLKVPVILLRDWKKCLHDCEPMSHGVIDSKSPFLILINIDNSEWALNSTHT